VIELRFHPDLYDGFAVDEAAKVYGPYGGLTLAREPDAYVVRVTAGDAADSIDERTLAAELSNYALGLTIEKRVTGEGADAGAAVGLATEAP
jgi:hypothetical protein